MEITPEMIGMKVWTSNGIGVLAGRVIEFGVATKAVVSFPRSRSEILPAALAFPISDVELIDEEAGELIQDLPGR